MPKTLTFIIATLLLFMSTYAYPHTDAAEAAALEWLKAIDSGEFDQAWGKLFYTAAGAALVTYVGPHHQRCSP